MIYTFDVKYTEGKFIKGQMFVITTAKSREEAFRMVLNEVLDFYEPNCLVSICLVKEGYF
jgi:hypothetical protein